MKQFSAGPAGSCGADVTFEAPEGDSGRAEVQIASENGDVLVQRTGTGPSLKRAVQFGQRPAPRIHAAPSRPWHGMR
jgi:hypothetical protein